MFEKASKLKLRFDCKGSCSVEDLWDLSKANLNNVFMKLSKELKEHEGDSLLNNNNEVNEIIKLKMDIVRHIFEMKVKEYDEIINRQKEIERDQKILEIISDKKYESLKAKSIEELEKELSK